MSKSLPWSVKRCIQSGQVITKEMAEVLEISEKDPLSTLNYLANIHENIDFNFHVLKWNNCVVLRNCNKKGELTRLSCFNVKTNCFIY